MNQPRTILALTYLLTVASTCPAATSLSERPPDSVRAVLIPLLSTIGRGFVGIPAPVATAFGRSIPDRILRLNMAGCLGPQGFTVEAMGSHHTAVRLPVCSDSTASYWACYMGGNTGYLAVVKDSGDAARVTCAVDHIAELIGPKFELVELTGDSIPELVLSGAVGLQMHLNGEIFSWDGTTWKHLTAGERVLDGYYWKYEDVGDGKTKRIVVYNAPTPDRAKGPPARQVVEYDKTLKALVWRAAEAVLPKQK